MDRHHTTTLMFRLDDESTMDELIRILSALFHVVPAGLTDPSGLVLSVEVDDARPGLVDEVRELVTGADPGAVELREQVTA